MRLQMIAAAGVFLFSTEVAASEGRGAAWMSFLSSSDGLTVMSPQASARVPLKDWLTVDASYDADIITAASVDLITAASPRGYTEVRHGLGIGATVRPAEATVFSAHYTPSFEPDYSSHTAAFSAEREWIDRRLTTQIGYRFSFDKVGRRGESPETWRSLQTHALSVGLGWVWSRRMVSDIVYEVQFHDGFQASAYRFVPIYYGGSNQAIGLPESVPDQRTRHAIAGGLRRAFGTNWFGSFRLRFYSDTWGILSFSDEIEIQRAWFGSRLLVSLRGRVYGQTSASFHKYRYEARGGVIPSLRDADKMLSSSRSFLGGPRVEVNFGRLGPISEVHASILFEWYAQRFFNFAPLSERYASVVSFGIAGEFGP